MAERPEEPDEQDQSEAFDETHLDDEGDGDVSLEEMDVLDVTQEAGDADDEDDEDLRLEEVQGLDGVDPRADTRLDAGEQPVNELDGESDDSFGADEIEQVPSGLMRNVRGAQASTAHWEARRLDDDDIDALGYGPDETREETR